MLQHSGIAIAKELNMTNMLHASDVPYISVLDLRFKNPGTARAIEEEVLLRLKNLHVCYQQLPIDMARPQGWQKNSLMRHAAENLNQVMIITDQPEAVSEFCRSIDVPSIQTSHTEDVAVGDTVPHAQAEQPSQAGFHQSVVI